MIKSTGNLDVEVKGIEYNSKKVKKGSVFVAIKGFNQDGTEFIEDALENGAVGVVSEKEISRKTGLGNNYILNEKGDILAAITVEDSRKALASLSADFFGHPSKELNVIGITGTNGKTTITFLIDSILKSAGEKTGVIGTISYRYSGKSIPASQTTPESLDLQKMYREMVNNKINHCILEVSSHSLTLNRVYKTEFATGVFTNLTQDHLDFHHNKEDYFKAKEKLFMEYDLKKAVINIDDPYGKLISERTAAETMTVSIKGKGDIQAENIETSIAGLKFTAKTPRGEMQIVSRLIGYHNVYNILCAIGASIASNASLDEIKKGISSLQNVPGRFEKIDEGQDFTVVVDYAHTDDALKNVINTARMLTEKRIITVFGCGGNRDKNKRPMMGAVAGRYGDYTIITSDNPRDENPASITAEVEKGIKKFVNKQKYCVILEREKAIEQAINIAETKDIVIIAGKGHEKYQVFRNRRIHFDDCKTAQKLIRKRMR